MNVSLANAAFLRDPRLTRVFAALNGDGCETRVVGGAVRNALLGEPIADIDLATTAPPEETTRRAQAAGIKVAPTGFDHGTVTLVVDGKPFEVTTLREDIETDGRRAKVLFGHDFAADARRRDFTVNALSVDANGALHDYVGGLDDIAARRIRFIGDASQRIREDYLRIIRFFRFHAAYGAGPMDRDALDASIAARDGLESLSRERIHAEMVKMMSARGVADVAREMSDAGLLGQLVHGVVYPARLQRLIAIEQARALPCDRLARLCALCVVVVEDAIRLREVWRLSNAEGDRLERAAVALTAWRGNEAPPGPGRLREMLFLHGRRAALDAALLAQAEACVAPDDSAWTSAWRFLNDTPEPLMPFSGAELLKRGVPAGRGMGEMLKTLQALWIRAGFPNDPHEIARLMDEARER